MLHFTAVIFQFTRRHYLRCLKARAIVQLHNHRPAWNRAVRTQPRSQIRSPTATPSCVSNAATEISRKSSLMTENTARMAWESKGSFAHGILPYIRCKMLWS